MHRFAVIGSSTPLLKCLPLFGDFDNAALCCVFLDKNTDSESIKWCEKNVIPFFDSKSIKNAETISYLTTLKIDWILSINSTVIIPNTVLQIPTKAALNLHPGILPEYAGLHTHQWAIRNGETEYGVTVHYMASAIDTGDIVFSTSFAISPKDTGLSLYLKCIQEGTKLMQHTIAEICNNHALPSVPQDFSKRALYTHSMALNGNIDFTKPAKQVLDFIRAADYAPFKSPTYSPTTNINGKTITVLKAQLDETSNLLPGAFVINTDNTVLIGCGDGCLHLNKVKWN